VLNIGGRFVSNTCVTDIRFSASADERAAVQQLMLNNGSLGKWEAAGGRSATTTKLSLDELRD